MMRVLTRGNICDHIGIYNIDQITISTVIWKYVILQLAPVSSNFVNIIISCKYDFHLKSSFIWTCSKPTYKLALQDVYALQR